MTRKREATTDRWASSFFATEDRGDVRILRFLPHSEPAGTDLDRMRPLWGFLGDQEKNPTKVLVIDTPPGLISPEAMDVFWEAGVNRRRQEGDTFLARQGLEREENAFHLLVERVQSLDCLVICVMAGRVDLPFLGLALACDYRIVSQDTVFLNRTLDAGLPPCGAAPWFLLRCLGNSKGTDVLLTKTEILAQFAHALGLVNKVVPNDELEQAALELAGELASKSAARLHAMKQAIRAANRSLDEYLDEESRIFTRCLHRTVAEAEAAWSG